MEHAYKIADWTEMGINIDGKFINNLKFADDILLKADTFDQAQKMLQELHAVSEKVGFKINIAKTQFMTNPVDSDNISVDKNDMKPVCSYK